MVGVGIDTVDVPRFREMIERRPGMLEKLFTEGEREYGLKHRDPAPSLAVRFAAKEATMKALGVGLGAFGFHDVEVVSLESGAPELKVTGAAKELADKAGVVSWKISLSHTCSVANAVVIAE
jgi:holo-[acyl-carrier protein] synthase